MQEVQKRRKHRLHIGNRVKRVSALPTKTVRLHVRRLNLVFRQARAFRQNRARLVPVQAAPRQILHADQRRWIVAHQSCGHGQLALRIESGLMQPVEEVFFLCGGFRIQRSPRFVFVAIADKAAQIECLCCICRNVQDCVCAVRGFDRLRQITFGQKLFRRFKSPVMQAVLRRLRKIFHRAALQRQRGDSHDDRADEHEARRRNGVLFFLPRKKQHGNSRCKKQHCAWLHERRRHAERCQQNRRQRRRVREREARHRKQNAQHDSRQPKPGTIRLRQRQKDAFFRGPKVTQIVPGRAEAVQKRRSREEDRGQQYNK